MLAAVLMLALGALQAICTAATGAYGTWRWSFAFALGCGQPIGDTFPFVLFCWTTGRWGRMGAQGRGEQGVLPQRSCGAWCWRKLPLFALVPFLVG